MLVLGIESSCDETAAAVVSHGERILSNVVASQVFTHEKYGGVVPELASREHLRKIVPVVREAWTQAGITLNDIEGIAVTEGPGLIGSLLVGLVYGKALAVSLSIPLVGVNHLEGHIQAVRLDHKMTRQTATSSSPDTERGQASGDAEVRFPSLALVVSGGHTSLFRVEEHRQESSPAPVFAYELRGQTRDDAAGEAFDKVAKLLALGYPGGPVIDRLARFGDPEAVKFGRIRMRGNPLDFSFSGLKTAVFYRVRGTPLADEAEQRRAWQKAAGRVTAEETRAHCSQPTLDLIASFQNAVVTDLVERTFTAARQEETADRQRASAADASEIASIFVSGGVACNSLLRERFLEGARQRGLSVFFPSPKLCTDNAAMIAAAGYFKLMAGERADSSLTAHACFPLGLPASPDSRCA
jgi:N6-L-threonylcarbamoyladenine synthase